MARVWNIQPDTNDLAAACAAAGPGDTIRLLAGVHRRPVTLSRSGQPGQPIRITADGSAVIDGEQIGHPDILLGLGNGSLTYPRWEDWAFFKLDGAAWIEFDGLRTVRNCWPCVVHGRGVAHIVVRDCMVTGGTYPLFFRDPPGAERLSRDLLVEDCRWRQDTSEDHFNWAKADWRHLHGELGGDGVMRTLLRHFNGAFFGSCDIGGRVTLRGNQIFDSYNGFRLGLSKATRDLGDTAIRRLNRDVEISENLFTRVRDNPVEPENHAHNWIVRHNTMLDCHTWFSMDAVTGGYWYVYGNRGWFRTRQGGPESTMGKVLKFSSSPEEPVPDKPVYFFNNSWFLRCPVAAGKPGKEYRIRELTFRNNAIQYCTPREPVVAGQPRPLCELGMLYIDHMIWSPSPGVIDHTVSDHPDFPDVLHMHGHEKDGIVATRPIFIDAANGDLRLAATSEARGKGVLLRLAVPGGGKTIDVNPADRGAWQGAALISVPELETAPFLSS